VIEPPPVLPGEAQFGVIVAGALALLVLSVTFVGADGVPYGVMVLVVDQVVPTRFVAETSTVCTVPLVRPVKVQLPPGVQSGRVAVEGLPAIRTVYPVIVAPFELDGAWNTTVTVCDVGLLSVMLVTGSGALATVTVTRPCTSRSDVSVASRTT
jgi:hypothetical protein